MSNALDVAAAILEQHPVDQMKLHKLLYFIQAASLAWFGEPAFDERIEAWTYGPVTRKVAGRYMDFDGEMIARPVSGDSSRLDGRTVWLVGRVIAEFADLSGPALAKLTKQPGSPWRQVRADLPDEDSSNREIPQDLIAGWHRQHGVFPSDPTEAEVEMARRFFDGSSEALGDLFESVTGVRPTRT